MVMVASNDLPAPPGPAASFPLEKGQPWKRLGLCVGLGTKAEKIFFPERGGNLKQGKKICQRCPVQLECLEYALQTNQKHGIWGGTSERERKNMKKERRTA